MSNNQSLTRRPFIQMVAFSTAILLAINVPAFAGAGKPGHGHGDAKPAAGGHGAPGHHGNASKGADIGGPGKASDVTRTIDVVLQDIFFEPQKITVKAGETVKFNIVNKGTLLHEFALGTAASHAEHKKMMEMMMEHGMIEADRINHDRMKMDHGSGQQMGHMHGGASGSALVEPGKSEEMIWKFSKAMKFEFACTVPGHYESGMVGPLTVQ